jgi:hypothetical protein
MDQYSVGTALLTQRVFLLLWELLRLLLCLEE